MDSSFFEKMYLFHQKNSSWIFSKKNDRTNKRNPASTCEPNSIKKNLYFFTLQLATKYTTCLPNSN